MTATTPEPPFISRQFTASGGFTSGIEGPACDRDGNLYAVNYARQGTIGRVTPDGDCSVFVELPAIGRKVEKDAEAAVVESVKAASEVYAPVSGTVTEVNAALADNPGLVNQSATGDGWFFRLSAGNSAEFADLMDEAAYQAFVASLS